MLRLTITLNTGGKDSENGVKLSFNKDLETRIFAQLIPFIPLLITAFLVIIFMQLLERLQIHEILIL